MRDVERAIAEIADIRQRLAASTRFRGYAPESLAVNAAMAVLVGVLLTHWRGHPGLDIGMQVLAWGTLMLASCASLTVEAVVRSRALHGELAAGMLRSALRAMLPVVVVGAATALTIAAYAPDALLLVPGLWLQVTALVCFAWQPIMPRAIVWPGLWYLASGIAVMVLSGAMGQTAPLLVAAALAIGHLIVAVVLFRAEKEANSHG